MLNTIVIFLKYNGHCLPYIIYKVILLHTKDHKSKILIAKAKDHLAIAINHVGIDKDRHCCAIKFLNQSCKSSFFVGYLQNIKNSKISKIHSKLQNFIINSYFVE